MEESQRICFHREEILNMFVEIEYILISLAKIGRYYSVPENKDDAKYNEETTKFIDGQGITARLSSVRLILSEKFDSTLGDDDMDELERVCQYIEYWKPPV